MLELYKGNNSDRITILPDGFDFADAGWSAILYVLDKEAGYIAMFAPKDMIKAADGKSFYVQIDPHESAILAEKTYLVAIIIKNDAANFKKDIYDEIVVRKTYAPIFDNTAPVLNSWDYNSTLKTITLRFSEKVKVSTLNTTGIKLLDAQSGIATYSLTGGTTSSVDGTDIVIALSSADVLGIAAVVGLLTDSTTSFISVGSITIKDMLFNGITAITDVNAMNVTTFI